MTDRYYFPTTTSDFFLPVPFTPSNLFSSQIQKGSDNDVSFGLGVLIRPTDKFWIGAVYHDGPDFTFTTNVYRTGEVDASVGAAGGEHHNHGHPVDRRLDARQEVRHPHDRTDRGGPEAHSKIKTAC